LGVQYVSKRKVRHFAKKVTFPLFDGVAGFLFSGDGGVFIDEPPGILKRPIGGAAKRLVSTLSPQRDEPAAGLIVPPAHVSTII